MARMFQRFVEKAALSDDYIDEYDEEFFDDDDNYNAEGDVVDIRAVDDASSAPDLARIVTVWPASFNDVQEFADQFRTGVPVILNLAHAPEEVRVRIIDFAMGVCYGLHGNLNKISPEVFLMTPRSVKMDDRRTGQSEL